jgi:hypothetical protein
MADYPPTHWDINKFFVNWLDHIVLEAHMVYTALDEWELDMLLKHIQDKWDWGARRTVYMYFKGSFETWRRFVNKYYEGLSTKTLDSFPTFKKKYSSYAVWLARKVTFEYEESMTSLFFKLPRTVFDKHRIPEMIERLKFRPARTAQAPWARHPARAG